MSRNSTSSSDLDVTADTPRDTIARIVASQRTAFAQSKPLDRQWRDEALEALHAVVVDNEQNLIRAIASDFGQRCRQETQLLEIFPLLQEIRYIRRNLRTWMRPRRNFASWPLLPSRTQITYQPLGVVAIIGPWNYPVHLTLLPLANALAAGNHVIIKPSELAPATADLLGEMIAATFPPEYVTVIQGGAETAAAVSELPLDHLLFTGSTRVGRLVMEAAAKNLTPVTLELGGKSPAVVHPSFPHDVAADRICCGKFLNAGQTCVAPDYTLVAEHRLDEFVEAARAAIALRYPKAGANSDYTQMINPAAHRRMLELVADARDRGARVIEPESWQTSGQQWERAYPPTLVVGATDDMRLMQEEIFGPVLPILTYDTLDAAIERINAGARPLALYYFDNDAERVRHLLVQTTSGGATINDCVLHVAESHLPFGGVGPSGMGSYHGFAGFETFSVRKSVLVESRLTGAVLDRLLRPPYGDNSNRMIRFLIGSRPGSARQTAMSLPRRRSIRHRDFG